MITLAFCGFSFGARRRRLCLCLDDSQLRLAKHACTRRCTALLLVAPLLFFAARIGDVPGDQAGTTGAHSSHCRQTGAWRSQRQLNLLPLPKAAIVNFSAPQIVLLAQYRFSTLMLWSGYFLGLFLVYLFSSWLPTLVKEGGGYSVADAAIVTAMFQIGGPGSPALGDGLLEQIRGADRQIIWPAAW